MGRDDSAEVEDEPAEMDEADEAEEGEVESAVEDDRAASVIEARELDEDDLPGVLVVRSGFIAAERKRKGNEGKVEARTVGGGRSEQSR